MMPKSLLLTGLILMVSAASFAQNTPRLEIGGDYSFAVTNLSSTNSPFFPAPVPFGQSFDMRGWGISLTENVDDWFGLTQDVSGLYANPHLSGFNHKTRIYSFLSGPRFSYRHIERITPYAHALFGYGQMSMKVPAAGGISASSESYAMALGGGLDVHLHGIFTLRLVQADYYLTRFFGSTQNNLRLSAGLVIQFGRTRY